MILMRFCENDCKENSYNFSENLAQLVMQLLAVNVILEGTSNLFGIMLSFMHHPNR